jgi:hypothetical protein
VRLPERRSVQRRGVPVQHPERSGVHVRKRPGRPGDSGGSGLRLVQQRLRREHQLQLSHGRGLQYVREPCRLLQPHGLPDPRRRHCVRQGEQRVRGEQQLRLPHGGRVRQPGQPVLRADLLPRKPGRRDVVRQDQQWLRGGQPVRLRGRGGLRQPDEPLLRAHLLPCEPQSRLGVRHGEQRLRREQSVLVPQRHRKRELRVLRWDVPVHP